MKRRLLAVALSAFAAFGLCACSDDNEEEEQKEDISVSAVRFEDGEGVLVFSDGEETGCGEEIEIPSQYKGHKIVGIDGRAFYGCDWITSVSIPESIAFIGEHAFAKCVNIRTLKVASVESWLNISFENSASNPMYFATELYVGGELAGDIVIPDSVTSIPDYAFYECENITGVSTGDGVTSIGENAFFNCVKLESVTIGNGVRDIGELAFAYCENLENLKIGNAVENIYGYAFNKCYRLKEVTIPASVRRIYECAFGECEGMTKLMLNEGLEYIGDAAFCDCASLGEFKMPNSVTSIGFGILTSVGGAGFGGIMGGAGSAGAVTMSDKITEIPDFTFSGCGMTSFTVGDMVTKINYSAFYGCALLESVVIPKSLKEVVSYSFYRCPLLNTVYYKGTAEEWNKIKIGKNGNDITGAEIYFYCEQRPVEEGNFWHYSEGVATKW